MFPFLRGGTPPPIDFYHVFYCCDPSLLDPDGATYFCNYLHLTVLPAASILQLTASVSFDNFPTSASSQFRGPTCLITAKQFSARISYFQLLELDKSFPSFGSSASSSWGRISPPLLNDGAVDRCFRKGGDIAPCWGLKQFGVGWGGGGGCNTSLRCNWGALNKNRRQ